MDNNSNPCVILCKIYSKGLFAMENSKLIEDYFLVLSEIVLQGNAIIKL
jgi:hypothetical protein